MRGRQQVYLTIGCASNWPDFAPHPWRDMPIFRGQKWAIWDYVQFLSGPRGMSSGRGGLRGDAHFLRAGMGYLGLCPALERAAGHVQWWGRVAWGMLNFRGQAEWDSAGRRVLGDYVQPMHAAWGMSCGGREKRRACPFFAGRTGLFGPMSNPRRQHGACPPGGGSVRGGLGSIGRCWKVQVF